MIDSSATASPKVALPIVFNTSSGWCSGWLHAANNFKLGVGVLLCSPLGYEANCTHGTYTQLAENLASLGFDVLRFDYQGTGDSAGSDVDPDRVKAWTDSIGSAVNELKRRGNVSRLALFGVRLGATLAAHTASQLGDIESLVMWAPCVTGRSFTRELRASSSNRFKHKQARNNGSPDDIEALGFIYTTQTLTDISALDCQNFKAPPAKRILIIDRDDIARDKASDLLAALYSSLDIETTHKVLPGYSEMMLEPQAGMLEHTTLDLIADWLSASQLQQDHCLQHDNTTSCLSVNSIDGLVRETALVFGSHQSLFGVLAEPAEFSNSNFRSKTGILMLNVGGNHHIGPNRIYVKMARSWASSGYRAFRFDLAGIGDSRIEAGFSIKNLYKRDCTADVRAAIDCLEAKGCEKIIVAGICSGAFVAFQSALVDTRITGQILMNPRLLEYQSEKDEDPIQRAMQSYYKSTHFYKRELLNPEVYRRIWRGEVDVKGIYKRFQIVLKESFKQKFDGIFQSNSHQKYVLNAFKRLTTQGTNTLLIIAAQDDSRDYIESQLGTQCCQLQGNPKFDMVFLENSDHTFSTTHSQQMVIAKIHEYLEKTTSSNGLTSNFPVATQTRLNLQS